MNDHGDPVDWVPFWMAFLVGMALIPIGVVVGDIPRTFLIGGALSSPIMGVILGLRIAKRGRRDRAERPLTASRGRG